MFHQVVPVAPVLKMVEQDLLVNQIFEGVSGERLVLELEVKEREGRSTGLVLFGVQPRQIRVRQRFFADLRRQSAFATSENDAFSNE